MTDGTARVLVFSPSPLLTVTIETRGSGPDVHLHAGGQGMWVARMVRTLGVPVKLCSCFGGETGHLLQTLVEREGVDLTAVPADVPNAAYVHDRRDGERQVVAEMEPPSLSRHEVDALYGAVVMEALDTDVCVLTGTPSPGVVPVEVYRRLAEDLRANDTMVVADLSGDQLTSALEGGVDVLKVSHEELERDDRVDRDRKEDLVKALRAIHEEGAANVVISRGEEPTLALVEDKVLEIVAPPLQAVDPRGGGDSMTAGLAVALARGEKLDDALRLAAAAAALNVTRRGLATGDREQIERMAPRVEVRSQDGDGWDGGDGGDRGKNESEKD
ncbi:MAG TPA: PfkB family carbohydrate kinase [Acidimicrobiales bacterium]|nr:PfkB family carbohydrate kinase [Acidimicrobiales bacterium]